VLRRVDHQDLPEGLARLNWISFGPGHDEDRAFGDLTRVLEEDLGWRDAHARLGVKAAEWSGLSKDSSYLLRRRDLRAAEEWLGHASQHVRTPPTPLQSEYVAASCKAASRTQRMLLAAVSAGLAIAVALAVVAYVQRDQARTEARLAQAPALAAESTADLASDPGQSLSLAADAKVGRKRRRRWARTQELHGAISYTKITEAGPPLRRFGSLRLTPGISMSGTHPGWRERGYKRQHTWDAARRA
jgi:hypothetical protein